MGRRNRDDHKLYQQLLEATRDGHGVVHRDQAVALLVKELTGDVTRLAEYAADRATTIANGFDNSHKPETDNGQMALDIDTYLVIGDNERVRVDHCMPRHTRQWLDIQARNHAQVAAAWGTKDMRGRQLLAIQDEQTCSMWRAEQVLRERSQAWEAKKRGKTG